MSLVPPFVPPSIRDLSHCGADHFVFPGFLKLEFILCCCDLESVFRYI